MHQVDALIARMEQQYDDLLGRDDRRHFFHGTYLRTTRAIAAELSAGGFDDQAWVERWDVVFADLYLEALEADEPAGPWRAAFDAAERRTDLLPIHHVLLGMNAHINYDLPQSLLTMIAPDEFDDAILLERREADHRHIDEVLIRRVDGEAREAAEGGMAMSRLDRLLAPANRFATKRFLREARSKVWANTMVLNRARLSGGYAEALAGLERAVTARIVQLTRPGPVLLDLAVRGFGVRLSVDDHDTDPDRRGHDTDSARWDPDADTDPDRRGHRSDSARRDHETDPVRRGHHNDSAGRGHETEEHDG